MCLAPVVVNSVVKFLALLFIYSKTEFIETQILTASSNSRASSPAGITTTSSSPHSSYRLSQHCLVCVTTSFEWPGLKQAAVKSAVKDGSVSPAPNDVAAN